MLVESASNTISESEYGTHALVIYENLETLREFYSQYIKKRIEEKNEFIQLASFYETEDSVRKTLSAGHVSIDVDKWEKLENSLMIMDSLKKYLGNESQRSGNNSDKNLVGYAKEKGKAGVSILGDMGPFRYEHRIQDLLAYELSLDNNCDIDLKRLCLYHQKDFNTLSKEQKQNLLSHHAFAIKI